MATLQLEINSNFVKATDSFQLGNNVVMFTPPVGEDYWKYRVKLSKKQAIIGFPKFGMIGVGFAVEDKDWNTNLPSSCEAEHIYNHIRINKGSKHISKANCLAAIKLIQDEVKNANITAKVMNLMKNNLKPE